MDWLTEPFRYGFMQTALVAALLVGVTCALLGAYVVLRGMAFIGDALAHTALPGLVVAYLLGLNLFFGAIAAGGLAALGIGCLSRHQRLREDTAIGILFTGLFAFGIVLISATQSFRDLTHMLFGDILGVTPAVLLVISLVSLVVMGALVLLHKELKLTSLDPTYARVIGLNPDTVRYILLLLLALAIVAGIQTVGVILVSALLVTPAATASLLTRRLSVMMGLAALVAVLGSVVGLYASYYYNVSSGAAIVLACTACFGLAYIGRAMLSGPASHAP